MLYSIDFNGPLINKLSAHMAIKKIITIDTPDNRLHEKCELVSEIDFNSDWLNNLIQDKTDSLGALCSTVP